MLQSCKARYNVDTAMKMWLLREAPAIVCHSHNFPSMALADVKLGSIRVRILDNVRVSVDPDGKFAGPESARQACHVGDFLEGKEAKEKKL